MSSAQEKQKIAPSILLWMAMLGGVGFLAGFIGPIVLNPDANQGPLVGIFITGPGGALAGVLLGLIARALPALAASQSKLLFWCCVVYGISVLFFCLPSPVLKGYLVDATVLSCSPPEALKDKAIAHWEAAVDSSRWQQSRPTWKADFERKLQEEDGVVLELSVVWKATLKEEQWPWNRGRITVIPWTDERSSIRSFFARYAGSECESYTAAAGMLFLRAGQVPEAWPPYDLPNYLNLEVIATVPVEYLSFIRGAQRSP